MPTRLDHAVIAVRDLDTALFSFQRLGFDARPGGRHADGGTHNGLIRFGLDYVELLSVYDEAEARASGRGRALLNALSEREADLIGYALASETIDEDARRFVGTAEETYPPHAMQRRRPDGHTLTWRIYAPSESTWQGPWPFLIQWDTPDALRLRIDTPGEHANGASGWKGLAVAVKDLARAVDIYHRQLGLKLLKEDACSLQEAQRVTFGLGDATIDLLTPQDEGSLQRLLEERGEGPYSLTFQVHDLIQTRLFFETQRVAFTYENAGSGKIILDPAETLGMRLTFVA